MTARSMRSWMVLLAGLTACVSRPTPDPAVLPPPAPGDEWPAYGRDPGGSRYAPLDQLHSATITRLREAWRFRTGEMQAEFATARETSLEVTPIVVDGIMYISTPLGRVTALDPGTG